MNEIHRTGQGLQAAAAGMVMRAPVTALLVGARRLRVAAPPWFGSFAVCSPPMAARQLLTLALPPGASRRRCSSSAGGARTRCARGGGCRAVAVRARCGGD